MDTGLLEQGEVREPLLHAVGSQNPLNLLHGNNLVLGIPGVTELGGGGGCGCRHGIYVQRVNGLGVAARLGLGLSMAYQ